MAAGDIDQLIANARKAQKEFEGFGQDQVDKVVKTIGKVIYDNARELAEMALAETGMGVLEDKVKKNQGKAKSIWWSLRDKKSVGIIDRDEENGLIYVAKPVGIVGAIMPTTNPIVTPMSNAMFALKGRNAIIIAPHPRAAKCTVHVVNLFNHALKKCGAPDSLIQVISAPSIEFTSALMKAVDVVVATGGMAMVKSAYSSGKPSYGVGAGNVQCILDRDIDIRQAVAKIIVGRTFDNGIICSGEQSVIAPIEDYDTVIAEFNAQGGYYIDDPIQKQKLRETLFPGGVISKDLVGQSVPKIAQASGLPVPAGTKVILVSADGIGDADLLCREKMFPVLVTFKYQDFSQAVEIAQTNLNVEGKGHTCVIHSNNKGHVEYAGKALTVSRLVVNQPCSTSAGGAFYNGLAPTTTLGCGTWGNNSISENFTYKHLLNVSRISYFLENSPIPSDEEIWA